MRGDASRPVDVEPVFWGLVDTVTALRNRDLGRVFRLLAVHSGASQTRIGVATGLSQGQVSQVMNGTRQLGSIDVLERVADGLAMPDKARMLLGLAPLRHTSDGPAEQSETYPATIEVAVTALDRLSVLDNDGRPDALTSRFTGLGFVTASRDWLVARSLAGWGEVDPFSAGHVALADVAAVRDTFAAFQELDTKYGGAYTHPALVQYIRLQAVPLLHAGCSDPVRRELFTAAAQLVYLTGLTAFDSGSCGIAERYFAYALRLAQECGEDGFAANILAAMAHLANTHGRGNEAAQLAQAGLVAAMNAGSHAAEMRLKIALARAYAIQGDRQASTTAISGAERALDLSGDRQAQRWTRFLDAAYLLGEMALCFIDLGQPQLAERFATQSVAENSGRHRRLVLSQAALATARGQLGDIDGAVGALTEALNLMGGVQSSRTLRSVGDALTAVRSASGPCAELARATAVLGPKASGACCPRVPIPSSGRVR